MQMQNIQFGLNPAANTFHLMKEDYETALSIAKRVYGPNATTSMINPILYKLERDGHAVHMGTLWRKIPLKTSQPAKPAVVNTEAFKPVATQMETDLQESTWGQSAVGKRDEAPQYATMYTRTPNSPSYARVAREEPSSFSMKEVSDTLRRTVVDEEVDEQIVYQPATPIQTLNPVPKLGKDVMDAVNLIGSRLSAMQKYLEANKVTSSFDDDYIRLKDQVRNIKRTLGDIQGGRFMA